MGKVTHRNQSHVCITIPSLKYMGGLAARLSYHLKLRMLTVTIYCVKLKDLEYLKIARSVLSLL